MVRILVNFVIFSFEIPTYCTFNPEIGTQPVSCAFKAAVGPYVRLWCHNYTVAYPRITVVAKTVAEQMWEHGMWCLLRPVGDNQSEQTSFTGGGLKEMGTKIECSDKGWIEL